MANKTFYVVATPIGNLEDITIRALRILKEVDLILCEDTRVTKKLLTAYEIKTPTLSYHTHSKLTKLEHIMRLMEEGKTLALVSDAGTPAISDPGTVLVRELARRFASEIKIIPIPGPSAYTALLSASGLPCSEFVFIGFLPHKKGRETIFKSMHDETKTVVFYESPHRIMKTLFSLLALGEKRSVVVGRELSKMFEEIVRGTPGEVHNFFTDHPDHIRGEFTVAVGPV
ncbi:MAG TPA: 16S rRNA (cytidine(1402)-2'-O)-methyltransferase [Candidatus Paceibacterota bacterium]